MSETTVTTTISTLRALQAITDPGARMLGRPALAYVAYSGGRLVATDRYVLLTTIPHEGAGRRELLIDAGRLLAHADGIASGQSEAVTITDRDESLHWRIGDTETVSQDIPSFAYAGRWQDVFKARPKPGDADTVTVHLSIDLLENLVDAASAAQCDRWDAGITLTISTADPRHHPIGVTFADNDDRRFDGVLMPREAE